MSDSTNHQQTEARRTQMFVSVAAVCVILTVLIKWSSAPASTEAQGEIGVEFYPEFIDPTAAKALEVYAFDAENVEPLDFEVARSSLNDVWTIPSHHNYPVDAEDRLAETAASVIGIQRGALATRWPKEHAKYGVVNPQTDSITVSDVEGVGKRIVIKGEKEEILADYIIGRESDDKPGAYYVRKPGDDNVYVCDIDIQLSTKFSDWISTDLLEIDASAVVHVSVETYSFDEQGGQIAIEPGDELVFSKPTAIEKWSTEGLDEETEEVDESKIRSALSTIGSLRIAGVRPKNQGLTADLKFDEELIQSQSDFQGLQLELLARGYALGRSEEDPEQLRLFSREGEIHVASEDGIVYELYFGRAFTGESREIEIGDNGEKDAEDDSADESTKDSAEAEATEGDEDDGESLEAGDFEVDESDEDDGKSPGRYLFVRARFDETFLGDKPVEPTPPGEEEKTDEAEEATETEGDPASESDKEAEDNPEEPSKGADDTDAEDSGCQEDSASEENNDPVESDTENAEPTPEDEAKDATEGDSEVDSEDVDVSDEEKPKTAEELQKEYEAAVASYEAALRLYDERRREGQEKVAEANKRYAKWYYVITGESYDQLNLEREDLVKAKGDEATPPPMAPGIPGLNIPGLQGN